MLFYTEPIFPRNSLAPMCHCATLAELPDGDLMAAWYAGAFETAPDQKIYAARYHLEHCRWTTPSVIVDTPGRADGQPVLHVRPDGALWLFFVTIEDSDWKSAQLKMQTSADGVYWSTPWHISREPGLMFRSKALNLGHGHLLVPIYDEVHWQSLSLISVDNGQTFHLGHRITTVTGNIHPTVVPLSDGRLLAFLRTGGEGGWIWQTISHDRGWTWESAVPTRFPNPNSGIDLIRLHNGHLVLAFNNSHRHRTPLCIALSLDQGETWPFIRTLAEGEGELAYPALLQSSVGHIHCVYTDRRETIQHSIFDEAWIREGDPSQIGLGYLGLKANENVIF